nr:hypothetical protein Iba_chr13aCG7530 [Ipomoea batatas]
MGFVHLLHHILFLSRDLLSRAVFRNHLQFLVTSVLSNELIGGFRWAPYPVCVKHTKEEESNGEKGYPFHRYFSVVPISHCFLLPSAPIYTQDKRYVYTYLRVGLVCI